MANTKFKVRNGLFSQNLTFSDSVENPTHEITFNMLATDKLSIAGDNTNLLVIDDSTGRIGIGTDSPDTLLHVSGGNITLDGTNEINHKSVASDYTLLRAAIDNRDLTLLRVANATTGASAADTANFGFALRYMGTRATNLNSLSIFSDNQAVGQIEALTILQDGKVGINSASPAEKLEIGGNLNVGFADENVNRIIKIYSNDVNNKVAALSMEGATFIIDGGVANHNLQVGRTTGSVYSNQTYTVNNNGSPSFFSWRDGTGQIMRLEEGGKLTLTTDPNHTSGDITTQTSFDLYNPVESDVVGKGSIITFSDNYFDNTNYIKTTRAAIKGGTATVGNTANGFLAFYTDKDGASSMKEQMRITKDGYVGINTSAPTAMLQVDSPDGNLSSLRIGRQDTANYWDFNHAGADLRIFNNAGENSDILLGVDSSGTAKLNKVGIGTATPTSILHVQDTTDPTITISNGGGTSPNPKLQFFRQAGVSASISYDVANKNLYFVNESTAAENIIFKHTATAEALRITNAGEVGIGITDPLGSLDVKSAPSGFPSLRVRSGDTLSRSNNRSQIAFSYNNADTYTHHIVSRHNSGADANNALDFYLWNTNDTVTTDLGSNLVMTLDTTNTQIFADNVAFSGDFTANGFVGIGTSDPITKTHIYSNEGGSSTVIDVLTIETKRNDVGATFAGGAIKFVNSDGNSAGQARIKVGSVNDAGPIGLNSESAQSIIFETSNSITLIPTSIDGDATTITVTHDAYSGLVPDQKVAITTGDYQGSYYIDTVISNTQFTIADTGHNLPADTSGIPRITAGAPKDSMIIRADGNVGIGTNAPSDLLHLSSSSDYAIVFEHVGQETFKLRHGTSGLYFTGPGSNTLLAGVTQNHDFDIFDTSGALYAKFDGSAGRLGIGTDSTVDTTLHVKSAGVNGILLDADTGDSTLSSRLFFETGTGTSGIVGVNGDLSFRRGMIIDNTTGTETVNIDGTTGDVSISSTTASTTTATGALTVAGGAGFGDTIFVERAIDGTYASLDGAGLRSNRGTFYIQPLADATQSLIFGASDDSTDWSSIILKTSGTQTFRSGANNTLVVGNTGITVGGTITTTGAVTVGGNINGTLPATNSTGTLLRGVVSEIAVENGGHYDPAHFNILAGADKRFTCTATMAGSPTTVQGNMFLGDSAHSSYSFANATDELVITISGFTTTNYTAYIGVTFGNTSFRAKDVKIETFRNGAWQTECDLTDQTAGTVIRQIANNNQFGVTQVRYTFKNPAILSGLRINNLFMFNYNISRIESGYDWNRFGSTTAYGAVSMLDDTTSTTSTTGALTVAGGVGIAENLNVGGALTASSLTFPAGAVTDALNLSNNNIIGVNNIVFADPGPSEGLIWSNISIFESPNDLTTNSAGNLQIVYGGIRRLTVDNLGIDVNGRAEISGDVAVNGGDITTTATTFNIVDTTATTVNIGGDATAVSIGAATGLTTVQNSLTVVGDLTVSGTTTTVNTTNLDVQDAVITLNAGQATPLNDIGILMQRYATATSTDYNVGIVWEEGTDRLIFGKTPEDGSDNDITFNTEWMTIKDTGEVGIGTDDPTKTLTVYQNDAETDVLAKGLAGAAAGNGALLYNENTTNGAYANLDFRAGTADGRIAYVYKGTTNVGDFQFITDNSGSPAVKMTLTNAGDLGVGTGTSAPETKFEVNISNATEWSDTLSGTGLAVSATDALKLFNTENTSTYGQVGMFFRNTGSGGSATGRFALKNDRGGAGRFAWQLRSDSHTTEIKTKMVLTDDGLLGVNTPNPTEAIHITQDMGATPTYIVIQQSGTNTTGGGGGIVFDTSATTAGYSTFVAKIEGVRTASANGSNELRFFTSNADVNSGAPSQHMVITENGKVGIGTTNPQQKLHVDGSIYLGPNNSAAAIHGGGPVTISSDGNINIVADTNDTVGDATAGDIIFGGGSYVDTDSNQAFTVGEYSNGGTEYTPRIEWGRFKNGNLGIGTDAPQAPLHLFGTDGETLRFGLNNTVYGKFNAGTAGARFDVTGANSGFGMAFSMDDDTKMTLLPNGNFGIGFASPGARLEVRDFNGTSTHDQPLQLWKGGNVDGRWSIATLEYTSDAGIFTIGYAGLTSDKIVLDGGTGASNANITLYNGSGTLTTQLSAEAVSYFNGGNVGIGEATPLSKLHVKDGDIIIEQGKLHITSSSNAEGGEGGGGTGVPVITFGEQEGTAAATASMSIGYDGDGYGGDANHIFIGNASADTVIANRFFVVTLGGDVGINVIDPDVRLTVEETQDTVANILSNGTYAARFTSTVSGDTGRSQGILLSGNASNTRGVALIAEAQSAGNDHDLIIATSASGSTPTERVRVDSIGNVGIGTDAPAEKLDILGSASTAARIVTSAANSYSILKLKNTGTDGREYHLGVGGNTVGTTALRGSIYVWDQTAGAVRAIVDSSGNVSIGAGAASAKLDVQGDIEVNSQYTLNAETATLSTITQTVIASYALADFGGSKIVIQATRGSERHMTELLVVHDGTTASATEYASIYTGAAPLATYDVDISGTDVRVLATSASATSTVYKVAETLMFA